jgi:hypothetical protein
MKVDTIDVEVRVFHRHPAERPRWCLLCDLGIPVGPLLPVVRPSRAAVQDWGPLARHVFIPGQPDTLGGGYHCAVCGGTDSAGQHVPLQAFTGHQAEPEGR